MRRIAAALLFVFSLVCCFMRPAFAQEGSATLTGFIQDSSKAVIPGAKVTAIDTNTNQRFNATTGKDGSYTIVSLPVGPYQMQIEKPGFKTILKDDLFLHTQDSLQINFEMAIGSTSETVTVNSTATNDSPAVSMVVTQQEIEKIPLNGRSFQDLIQLAPGAVSSAQGNGTFSINGQRDDANNFTVDGVSANLGMTQEAGQAGNTQAAAGVYPAYTALGTTQTLLSVDAMQEFRIQTSGYTAEYGRQPGGQVEITSRSGTNQFHGTAYDYLRNTVFDANNWFSDNTGIPKQAEHQNDFGGTLGGPFTIPRVYDGSKTFFLVSYEGLRLLLPQTLSLGANPFYVPTIAFRESAAPGVQPFLNAFPLPSPGSPVDPDGITAAFFGGVSTPSSINATSVRVDQTVTDKYHLFLRIADTPTYSETVNRIPGATESLVNQFTITAGATAALSTNLTDELRFNYSRSAGANETVPFAFGGATSLPLGLLVPDQYASLPGGYFAAGSISVPGTSLYLGYQYDQYKTIQHQLQLIDSVSWTRGSHTLKFGADYRRLSPSVAEGQYQVYFGLSSLSDIQNGVSDYLEPETASNPHPLFTNLSLYAQDHWRLSPRLTLDYGLRWEFDPPPGTAEGLAPLALTSSDLATATIAPPGTHIYRTSYTNFAPRLGLAWQINHAPSHPIVLRGGTGIFYDTGQNLGILEYSSVPFLNFGEAVNVPMPFSAADLAPPPLGNLLENPYLQYTKFTLPDLELPWTAQWNLSIDAGLGERNTMTVSYVGNVGNKLLILQGLYANNPNFAGGLFNFYADNAADSSYNALQVQDRGYIGPHLQVIASYTWSHAIDDQSGEYSLQSLVQGNSDNDLRQMVNGSLNYELPEATSNRSTRALTHGWSLESRFGAQSGYPAFVIQGTYQVPPAYQVTGYVLPNLVKGVPLYLHNQPDVPGGFRINPAAFSPVALNPDGSPVAQGDIPRNFVRGPGFWTMNSALQKSTRLGDRITILFRTEAFNVFNHPSFGGVQTYLPAPNFGEPGTSQTIGVANPLYASGGPRSLQFMLKLQF